MGKDSFFNQDYKKYGIFATSSIQVGYIQSSRWQECPLESFSLKVNRNERSSAGFPPPSSLLISQYYMATVSIKQPVHTHVIGGLLFHCSET